MLVLCVMYEYLVSTLQYMVFSRVCVVSGIPLGEDILYLNIVSSNPYSPYI